MGVALDSAGVQQRGQAALEGRRDLRPFSRSPPLLPSTPPSSYFSSRSPLGARAPTETRWTTRMPQLRRCPHLRDLGSE